MKVSKNCEQSSRVGAILLAKEGCHGGKCMKDYGRMDDGTSPVKDVGGYTFRQLIDLERIKNLLELHHNLSGMTYSLFDTTEERMLIAVGWQDICLQFHRTGAASRKQCRESDGFIKINLNDFHNEFFEYRCKNGMIHVAMPIVIDHEHLATFFVTQFFYDDDKPDTEYFRNQATTFGFDTDAYLSALAQVPVFNRGDVHRNLLFLCGMVKIVAEMGLNNLRLAREVEKRLRAEKRFALLDFALDHVREEVFIINEDARLCYVNNEAKRTLGYTPDELMGMIASDVFPDFPPECWDDRWHNLKVTGSRLFGGHYRKKNGDILLVEIKSNYFEYENCGYNLALVRDLTENKRLETTLRKRERQFRTLAENSPVNIIRYDRQCRAIYFNPMMLKTFGSNREILGKTPTERFPGVESFAAYEAQVREVLKTGEPAEIELAIPIPDGAILTHSVNLVAERDEQGNIDGALAIGRDITERKRAQERLLASERQFRILSMNSPGVMFSSLRRTDGTSCMLYISPRIEELNGLHPEDMTSDMSASDARIHPDDVSHVHESIAESERNLSPWQVEFRWRHPIKGEVWVEGRSTPERQQDGSTVWFGFFHDITKHKKLERELFTAKKMEIIGQLAGGVAHEVRNPLNAILSIAEALFKEKEIASNHEYQPYIDHIRTQVNRLSRLMTDLLNLGKPIIPAMIKPVPIGWLCKETIRLWNSTTETARDRPIAFLGDSDNGGPWVLADGIRLQQAILNLIDNAAQCSPKGSEILLRLLEIDLGTVAVQVKDYGDGIADEKIGRVYEPFFTLRKGGTGLGLTLVKHFIEHMGGEIRMWNNEPPPGCTAELILETAETNGPGYETEDSAG